MSGLAPRVGAATQPRVSDSRYEQPRIHRVEVQTQDVYNPLQKTPNVTAQDLMTMRIPLSRADLKLNNLLDFIG